MRPRLLAIGYGQPGFGFGRVLQSLLGNLCDTYEVYQYDRGAPRPDDRPWKVCFNQQPGDPLGERQLQPLVERVRPAIVLILAELWDVERYVRLFRDSLDRTSLVAYCPIDGPLKAYRCVEALGELSCLVLYTEFGRAEVTRALARLRAEGKAVRMPRLGVIPHGVDTSLFYPYSTVDAGRRRARSELCDDRAELADAFIVLNANRNQSRKRIDLTLEGFRLFALRKPANVLLYLHMGIIDSGINILGWARELGIDGRIVLTTNSRAHPIVSDAALNRIYNACDVGLNTAAAEGWGLVSFEHAATGAAQVVPGHATCAEIWNGSALLLPPVEPINDPFPLGMWAVSAFDVAAALERLYADRTLLRSLSAAAYRQATRPEFRWEAVAARFDGLFRELLPVRT